MSLSHLVFRAGCGVRLYRFLIIAFLSTLYLHNMDRVKRIWYLAPMRAAKVQASLRIRAVSPEPPLLAHTSSESRGTFRQKATSLAPMNGWACAVKICHDGMLEDTNSLDGAHIVYAINLCVARINCSNYDVQESRSRYTVNHRLIYYETNLCVTLLDYPRYGIYHLNSLI